MKNIEVVKNFIYGRYGQSGSMSTDGNRLWSYNTCIAQKSNKGIIVNCSKYSVTTSKSQHYLRREIAGQCRNYVNVGENVHIPMNTQDLMKYLD